MLAKDVSLPESVPTLADHHCGTYPIVVHGVPPPGIEESWRNFLCKADCPSAYVTPEFFHEPFWGSKGPFAILAFKQSEMVGVLTGLHTHDRITSGLPSRPQLCTIDDCSGIAINTLMDGLLKEAGRTKLLEVFAWHSTPLLSFLENGFEKRQLEGTVVLDLRLGPEALFRQFHDNRKRNIRIAIRNGIEVFEATEDDFPAYWDVYCRWQQTERKKIYEHTDRTVAQKAHHFTVNRRRFLARYQGKIIAATTVRFCTGGLIEYSSNCSLDEFIALRPNDLLIWETIRWACTHKFRKYSLGAAHPFLRKTGGVVEPIDRYRLDRTLLHRYQLVENLHVMPRKLLRTLSVRFPDTMAYIDSHRSRRVSSR